MLTSYNFLKVHGPGNKARFRFMVTGVSQTSYIYVTINVSAISLLSLRISFMGVCKTKNLPGTYRNLVPVQSHSLFVSPSHVEYLSFGECQLFYIGKRYHGKRYRGGVAEWFRALDLKSGGPWFKSSTLPLSGFVLGSPEFNSSTALCK